MDLIDKEKILEIGCLLIMVKASEGYAVANKVESLDYLHLV